MNNAVQEITEDATSVTLAIYYRDALGRVVAEKESNVGTVFRIYRDGNLSLAEFATTGRTRVYCGTSV